MKRMILLIILTLIFTAGCNQKSPDTKSFAQCLTGQGIKMYGASWCYHCKQQKAIFGQDWVLIDYIECANPENAEKCKKAGIEAYPTWYINASTRVKGKLSFQKLSKLTGCKFE